MKHFLHRFDRAMIYIFIASSYFPWLTVGTLSCWMLRELRWAIWLFAILGITYQQIFHERYKMLELLLYLIMGLGPAAIIVTSNVCPFILTHYLRMFQLGNIILLQYILTYCQIALHRNSLFCFHEQEFRNCIKWIVFQ